jgi:hypothetical protein
MTLIKDITGKKFGRWTVIKFVKAIPRYNENGSIKSRKLYYLCKCDCGNERIVVSENLKSGKSKSCGCIRKENPNFKTHWLSNTRLYTVYVGMKARCYNPNNSSYKNYGERGITVCDEWLKDFKAFYDWAIANGYDKTAKRGECTLDRINNNIGYTPENCRWVSQSLQNNNTRRNKLIKFRNEIHTLKEWSVLLSLPYTTLSSRLNKYKWSIDKAFSTPKQ